MEDTLISASELYDFLSVVTPDYSATTLAITPQGSVTEESSKNQVVHLGVDGSEERISFGTASIFFVTMGWNILSEANSGTIHDFYNDAAKANACQRTFKLTYGDGHTYVARFDVPLTRAGTGKTRYGIQGVRFKIVGRVAD